MSNFIWFVNLEEGGVVFNFKKHQLPSGKITVSKVGPLFLAGNVNNYTSNNTIR